MSIPEDLSYTKEHEWISREGDVVTIGITAFAAEALGDVVFVELPSAGDKVEAGTVCGEIESTKSVSELFAPLDGEVTEINQAVVDNPELLNSDPYEAGWLLRVRTEDTRQLLDSTAYAALIQED
ncbi:glycine cleavage system protein H [Prauserella marina]|uniref:Glycine cleavage system H protein n=1 Tax=Prauserella marina TaxID=530584 RepID=A0A222VN08_9PSEU|nr:glycine cleavage system protein GcvH [Prauserella marina]ASR35143.1 glycine cleavage system protein H [Prauserella marina]PWV85099.1 glycine cleavage system H protein [Prauserella marina]SDC04789.1 glycine cleavage system H protein [Prauserella marina]